jgi:hypothetical protein
VRVKIIITVHERSIDELKSTTHSLQENYITVSDVFELDVSSI